MSASPCAGGLPIVPSASTSAAAGVPRTPYSASHFAVALKQHIGQSDFVGLRAVCRGRSPADECHREGSVVFALPRRDPRHQRRTWEAPWIGEHQHHRLACRHQSVERDVGAV